MIITYIGLGTLISLIINIFLEKVNIILRISIFPIMISLCLIISLILNMQKKKLKMKQKSEKLNKSYVVERR